MEILKCNAKHDRIYYVEYQNALRECKFLKTIGKGYDIPMYVLNIAKIGIVTIQALRQRDFHRWYHASKIQSVLYASIEDFQNKNPLIDAYGSMNNCYNSQFITPLFKYHQPCNCGGSTYTWRWNGYQAVRHIVSLSDIVWSWDNNYGFQCSLNEQIDCYKTEQDCLDSNQIRVITF